MTPPNQHAHEEHALRIFFVTPQRQLNYPPFLGNSFPHPSHSFWSLPTICWVKNICTRLSTNSLSICIPCSSLKALPPLFSCEIYISGLPLRCACTHPGKHPLHTFATFLIDLMDTVFSWMCMHSVEWLLLWPKKRGGNVDFLTILHNCLIILNF